MEVHQLRYLVALAQEGSFSRAAERMRVAQPSLSQQIQKLEAEVGQPLFDRLPRGVMLTGAGRKLLPFARRILTELADAQRTVDECRSEPSGTVAVGIIPTIAPYVLRPLLDALAEEYPNVAVNVFEDVTEALVRRLEDGEIDLAIVSTCRNGPGILRETWTREPLRAALPQRHPLAQYSSLSWHQLRGEPFLVASRRVRSPSSKPVTASRFLTAI
jgi:LysR family transcriptional regulator, hydrogen peroxide-inducible genes activator